MRILFVVDGRSPIALNWIAHFVEQGHEVHLASTFPCTPGMRFAGVHIVQVAFSQAAGDPAASPVSSQAKGDRSRLRRLIPVGMRTALRQRFGPWTLPRAAERLKSIVEQIHPDLIHAMRIPYEGMLAAQADLQTPLLISIWGNDFTLHAPSTARMGRLTRQTLARADALHADCQRDIRLARGWGFPQDRPYRVLPGGGGIQLDLFSPPQEAPGQPVVINPRGFRAYVRNDAFFDAIPLVLARHPQARFICPTMARESQAQAWVQDKGISSSVELLPVLPRPQMADLFRRSQVVVSPSTHDGTPNTLLEGMACGCFPVVGDIESLREWITPGVNGLLVDPGDPQAIAEAILLALEQAELRRRAAVHNRRLVEQRAEYGQVMAAAGEFYQSLLK